jgi:rhodanese-related sulfurtransferase
MPSIRPEDLAAQIESGQAPVILDVRSRAEYEGGHVPGAINVPFTEVAERVSALPARPEDPIIVYCGHGPRAWLAGVALRRRGFRRVSYLKGHMSGWKKAGLAEEIRNHEETKNPS